MTQKGQPLIPSLWLKSLVRLRLAGSDWGLYRSHILIIPPCLDYDTNRVFGHREGACVASSWEL